MPIAIALEVTTPKKALVRRYLHGIDLSRLIQ
jgi:hypothetical protein